MWTGWPYCSVPAMALAKLLITLLYLNLAVAQNEFFPNVESPFGDVRLTAERGGPPVGAAFEQIKVINIPKNQPPLSSRPISRPNLGRPPPPPVTTKRPRKPRPSRPTAPQPLPIPVSVSQEIPLRPQVSGNIPGRPHGVTVVTPMTEIRPDLETVATTVPPPHTTTPNALDALPAYYQRFIQKKDGSYYFDYAAPNSVQRLEQGFFKRDDFLEFPILVKSGAYSFISPEGIIFRVDYVADERGYRAFSENKGGNEIFILRKSGIE